MYYVYIAIWQKPNPLDGKVACEQSLETAASVENCSSISVGKTTPT